MLLHLSTWAEVEEFLTRSKTVVIPIGSNEQHGPTGLLGTDWLCPEIIAHEAQKTGDILVNLDAKTVEVGGARVHLTGKEYQMLELLSLRKGTTLTKEMFLNHLYGGMDEPELKIIDVFICKLRKKLAAAADGKHHIETVWGRGYVLRDPHEAQVAA